MASKSPISTKPNHILNVNLAHSQLSPMSSICHATIEGQLGTAIAELFYARLLQFDQEQK